MARTAIKKIDKKLAKILEDARKNKIPMTVASAQLADFAIEKGFTPKKKKRLPWRKSGKSF